NITPSRYDAATAYITVDLHQMGDFDPYVYKTSDYGNSWQYISGGVPKSVSSFCHVIKEDPKMKGMLYLGTDNALYISPDDGKNWMPLQNNLPPAPVYWLEIQERFDDLVVGTYGRGYWIMDDIAAIRGYFRNAQSEEMHLFSLRPSYRFQNVQGIKTDGPSLNAGQNPPYGAGINYYLKDSSQEEVTISILKDGEIIRTMEGDSEAGINRFWWDLRYEATYTPKLRTQPPGRPWAEMNGEGWRPLVSWDLDLDAGQLGPKVVPGKYTVKVKVGDKEMTRDFEVLKDPNTESTLEDIEKQVAFSLELRSSINETVTLINKVEWIRKELDELIPLIKNKRVKKAANELKAQSVQVSSKLY
ncbi:MAG: glycosyl hydrolase, partial [Bacteroidota bacterium]